MTTLANARKNCPAHNGVAQEVREAMKQAGEPLSPYKLSLLCGRKLKQIKTALGGMMETGGIVSIPSPKCTLYALYKPVDRVPSKPEQCNRAAPITHGRGSRWGLSLL